MNNIYTILYLTLYVIQNSILSSKLQDYIVVLKKGKSTRPTNLSQSTQFYDSISALKKKDFKIKFNYTLFPGYLASMSKKVYKKLAKDKNVLYIEKDQSVKLSAIQRRAPWGLARLETREKINPYRDNPYRYHPDSGMGVNIYVIDSGVYTAHSEFEGRATVLNNPLFTRQDDQSGHGTHIAGITSGKTYGVSKKARIFSIKVFGDGQSSVSTIVKGLEIAIIHSRNNGGKKGNVINMSLVSGYSEAFNYAIGIAVNENIPLVAAAGNYYKNSCSYFPGSSQLVIGVGATDANDKFASYSNYGKCVDILAPGTDILSAGIDSLTHSSTQSGTSMATAHVSGLVAYIMSKSQVRLTNRQILEKLIEHATTGKINAVPRDTPNTLAYNYVALDA